MTASCHIPISDNQLIEGAILFAMVASALADEMTALITHEKRAPRSSSYHGA
ncbi:MAG: hypothetical protein ACYDD1_12995 [Caulobacteraceae bacterium]